MSVADEMYTTDQSDQSRKALLRCTESSHLLLARASIRRRRRRRRRRRFRAGRRVQDRLRLFSNIQNLFFLFHIELTRKHLVFFRIFK